MNASGKSIHLGISLALLVAAVPLLAQRVPVLNQVDLPHNYYFRELYLPQLTGGPSSVAWASDGKSLVYSMAGSLWKQGIGSSGATQLTDDEGYDYQPDVSPDGTKILFVRYKGSATDLMVHDLAENKTFALTDDKNVNLEPRWSPDGKMIAFVSTAKTGHFLLHTATMSGHVLSNVKTVIADRKSEVKRYYYSAYDHAINPCWSRDGKSIYIVSNREVVHGTGNICQVDLATGEMKTIHREETSWRTRPDLSPDGTRLVYSSNLGQNWQQLWMVPAQGGYAVPLMTYGDYEKSSPRWSPDGKKIAFISNENGTTSLNVLDAFSGKVESVAAHQLNYLKNHASLTLRIQDESGNPIAARVSVTDSRGKFHGPEAGWIQADDSRYPALLPFESHYFHCDGQVIVSIPDEKITLQVSHGPAYEIVRKELDANDAYPNPVVITMRRLPMPPDFGNWWSGDVHLHMNYGGIYRNTPPRFVKQAEAEDLNFMFNLIVNKEQRLPDINYFSTLPDKASTDKVVLLHGQEFHTSVWGHLGLLHLKNNLILPDYSGYPQTALASLFPHNGFVADKAHEQGGFVGYVHPFEQSEVFPDQSATLYNMLPVDAALGKVDYYELIGFSDHRASEAVWYQLLNAGLRIPAAAGTDVMGNYASLRGPVGLTRVYVRGDGPLNSDAFLQEVMKGKSFVTNGPLLGLRVNNAGPGEQIKVGAKGQTVTYTAFVRSNTAIDHVEVVVNGVVVASHVKKEPVKNLDVQGKLKIDGPGWILLRAWNSTAQPEVHDLHAYASTNPVYIGTGTAPERAKSAGEYFLRWLDRLENFSKSSQTFRDETERAAVVNDIEKAKLHYVNIGKAVKP